MAITRTAMVDDDGTGTTGTVINNAWKQQFYDQIDAANAALVGAWTAIPYNAANFTGSGSMTWAVEAADVTFLRYVLLGKTCVVTFGLANTVVGGTLSTTLKITIPITVATTGYGLVRMQPAGQAWEVGVVDAAGTLLNITRTTIAAFTAGTTQIYGTVIFEAQ